MATLCCVRSLYCTVSVRIEFRISQCTIDARVVVLPSARSSSVFMFIKDGEDVSVADVSLVASLMRQATSGITNTSMVCPTPIWRMRQTPWQ